MSLLHLSSLSWFDHKREHVVWIVKSVDSMILLLCQVAKTFDPHYICCIMLERYITFIFVSMILRWRSSCCLCSVMIFWVAFCTFNLLRVSWLKVWSSCWVFTVCYYLLDTMHVVLCHNWIVEVQQVLLQVSVAGFFCIYFANSVTNNESIYLSIHN